MGEASLAGSVQMMTSTVATSNPAANIAVAASGRKEARNALHNSPPALRGEMPKAEGGSRPDSPAWLYLAKRRGDGVRLVQRILRHRFHNGSIEDW